MVTTQQTQVTFYHFIITYFKVHLNEIFTVLYLQYRILSKNIYTVNFLDNTLEYNRWSLGAEKNKWSKL